MTSTERRLARLEAHSPGNDLRSYVRRMAAVEGIDEGWLLREAERVLAEVRESGMTVDELCARQWGCTIAEVREQLDAVAARCEEATR